MLVADGIGGASGGEVASRLAITTLTELVLRTPDWIMHRDGHPQLNQLILQRMVDRFERVHEVVVQRGLSEPDLAGMGTTLTVACTQGTDLLLIHVGDSRAYLCRRGQLLRLTRDQTVAQSMVDAGLLRPEEAEKHRLHHVLTGGIGVRVTNVQAELLTGRLQDGDQLLLCSDGLTDMVPESAIAEVLQVPGPAETICHVLIDRALEAGGKDNVTVILGRYHIPQV
jgi:protein phosphatase